MEIILILFIVLGFLLFLFILIEKPYYLISIYIFLHLYMVNFEIPGPLDLRGWFTIFLFLRIIVFDQENLLLLKQSLSNKFIVLALILVLYSTLVYVLAGKDFLIPLKLLVLNISSVLLGTFAFLKGYGKKVVIISILLVGMVSVADLIYTYFVRGALYVRRIVDLISGAKEVYNHNYFGLLCGQALIASVILYINSVTKKNLYLLISSFFVLGILTSTSRSVILTTIITLVITLYINKNKILNSKLIFKFVTFIIGILLFVVVSYTLLVSSMNISSQFADQIYWRLVKEPLSFFDQDYKEYTSKGNLVEGTMRWRMYKTFNDLNTFFQKESGVILFGYGRGGYKYIGITEYKAKGVAVEYASHNFYTNLLAEIGLIGLIFFLTFLFSLLFTGFKMTRKNEIHSPLAFLVLYFFLYSMIAGFEMFDNYAFVLYGGIIAEISNSNV